MTIENEDTASSQIEDQKSEKTSNVVENSFPSDANESSDLIELNNRIKADLMAHCLSCLQDDDDARQCVQRVWRKYLRCVGDVGMLSAFFDTLPFHVKKSVLPKYQNDIMEWCNKLFHLHSTALLCSTYYSETFQRVIRYGLKNACRPKSSGHTAIIYISMDFDPNLIMDLTSSLANIKFKHIRNDPLHEDIIDINQLEEFIQQDSKDTYAYPFMVIANAGTSLLGRCDDLTRIKSICDQHDLWLHVIGDLLGSLALLPTTQADGIINCDSLTLDIIKLFGIQNLPYLTFFLRSTAVNTATTSTSDHHALITSHPLYDFILHSPSISFLSVWSISQRCSNNEILHHMRHSFDLSSLLLQRIKSMKTLRIVNEDDQQGTNTYLRIWSGNLFNDVLPKPVVVFRFEPNEIPQTDNLEDFYAYIDLLNLWLFDKLSQDYPKMNLELLKSIHFQIFKSDENHINQRPAHAFRFAPLEHVLDIIERDDMQAFLNDLQRYSDILLATMTGRVRLSSIVSKYDNLIFVPIAGWAGIGAVRYIPEDIQANDLSQLDEVSAYQIDSIQAELARKLQHKDSAFSLGGGVDESDPMFYLRLGMIKKAEDLDILLQKISDAGKEVEVSLKYVEDMAEKIKEGIEKVQKDLYNENLQLLAQGGLLRQLPLVSNIMSWWSPDPSASSVATKGRSYDLNTGCIESTEETYINHMQIKKQPPIALTHNASDTTSAAVVTINTAAEKKTNKNEQESDK